MAIPASQQVNRLGKYLNKHIDSAYKYRISGNENDIWFTVFYEYLITPDDPHQEPYYSSTQEMHINLNITTYQNKIRVNLIEVSPDESTVGYLNYPSELFDDLQRGADTVMYDIQKRLTKLFSNYVFIW